MGATKTKTKPGFLRFLFLFLSNTAPNGNKNKKIFSFVGNKSGYPLLSPTKLNTTPNPDKTRKSQQGPPTLASVISAQRWAKFDQKK
jgi:hypothetical protein